MSREQDLAHTFVELADTLVDHAIVEDDRARWRFTEHRNPEPLLPPGLGWMQGAAGIVTAPDGHLARVAEIAKRHGALLIVDEIATGFGRTGKMFAVDHAGVRPDIIVMAKGMASGFPIAAIGAPVRLAITAASATSGWRSSTSSTSAGTTFSPPLTIMSSIRSWT